MKAAKKPVSNATEAFAIPSPFGSRFARMLLPAPWFERIPAPVLSIAEMLRALGRRLAGLLDVPEPEEKWRRMGIKPGTEIEDYYGCSYHVGRDGSLRLGVSKEELPDELYGEGGKPLRGRGRRAILRKAKLIVQVIQRKHRALAARIEPQGVLA